MPAITPASHEVSLVRDGMRRDVMQINRIAGPLPTGETLVKDPDGVWRCVSYPSQSFLDTCEWVFLGGHTYEITDELYLEMFLALQGTSCMPDSDVVPVASDYFFDYFIDFF